MKAHKALPILVYALLVAMPAGCGDGDDPVTGNGGSAGSKGGSTGSGGSASSSGGTGGSASGGQKPGSGGSVGTAGSGEGGDIGAAGMGGAASGGAATGVGGSVTGIGGGLTGTGGAASGGAATGGTATGTGGAATGGTATGAGGTGTGGTATATGGAATGGTATATGGAATGGTATATGGAASGGTATGGVASGGTASGTGGAASGGSASGGRTGGDDLLVCTEACTVDSDCFKTDVSNGRICSPTTHRCVFHNCDTDDECVPLASAWTKACTDDAGCSATQTCVDVKGAGRCATARPSGGSCVTGSELSWPHFGSEGSVTVCAELTNKCIANSCIVPCQGACTAPGAVCNPATGVCDLCSSDAFCGGATKPPHCNVTTGRCECQSDAECGSPRVNSNVCVNGRCGCTDASICTRRTGKNVTSKCE